MMTPVAIANDLIGSLGGNSTRVAAKDETGGRGCLIGPIAPHSTRSPVAILTDLLQLKVFNRNEK
jgi:hypothetical protein